MSRDLSPAIKRALWSSLLSTASAELSSMTRSQKETHAGATHEEAKPENSKDTRALEQTYLARGLAVRVAELRAEVVMLEAYLVKDFGPDDPIAITALVLLEDDDGKSMTVLIAPGGGGLKLKTGTTQARVVSPESPIGRALLGKLEGDIAELAGPNGKRELEIIEVA